MKAITSSAIAAALIGLASISAQAAPLPADMLGTPSAVDQASRTIVIGDSTRYINVQYGEIVKFEVNGKSFAVQFNGVRGVFDLNALAPAGVLGRPVKAYVSPSWLDERVL